jgi:hypothetical protein
MRDLSMWIGKYLSVLLLVLIICTPTGVVLPVKAAPVVEDTLLNDTSIYILEGNTWHFYQGYNLTIKSVNQEADSVWLELSLGNKILQSVILREGDLFIYQKNDLTLLNITVDTIYAGDDEELVAFSPVFQYLDRTLPEPLIPEDENNQEQNSSLDNNISNGTNGIEGFKLHMAVPVIVTIAALMLAFRKKDP